MLIALLLFAGQAFSCPATLEGHQFQRPSIYNGSPGKQEYELAPDEDIHRRTVTQTWKLSDYREMNLFVRCRYAGTGAVVLKPLPQPLKACSFSWRNRGGPQPIADPVFVCR
jgi:hypothetical protein